MKTSIWMKLALFVVCAAMMLSLFACDKTPDETTGTNEPTNTETEVPSETDTSTPTETETETPTESEIEVPTETETTVVTETDVTVPTETETQPVETESASETETESETESAKETESETESETEKETEESGDVNILVNAEQLAPKADASSNLGEVKLSDDKSYVSIYGNGTSGEGTFSAISGNTKVSGQYMFLKYRFPSTNVSIAPGAIEVFTSTTNAEAVAGDNIYPPTIADGEWHVIIVDLKAAGAKTFTADADGNYTVKYIRLDILNQTTPTTDCIDVAYFGFADSIEKIFAYASEMEIVQVKTTDVVDYYTADGTRVDGQIEEVLPESKDDVFYRATFDGVNGKNIGSTEITALEVVNIQPDDARKIKFTTGWFATEGGVKQFLFSVDGGATKVAISGGMANTVSAGRTDIKNFVASTFPYMLETDWDRNSVFNGLTIDLSGLEYHNFRGEVELWAELHNGPVIKILVMHDVYVDCIPQTWSVKGDGSHTETTTCLHCGETLSRTVDVCVSDGTWYFVEGELKEYTHCRFCQEQMPVRDVQYANAIDAIHSASYETGSTNPTDPTSAPVVLDGVITPMAGQPAVRIDGWFAVYGGVERYVYKVDNGEWKDITAGSITKEHFKGSTPHQDAINGKNFGWTWDKSDNNGRYWNVILDLAEYQNAADPVHVVFGAVLADNPTAEPVRIAEMDVQVACYHTEIVGEWEVSDTVGVLQAQCKICGQTAYKNCTHEGTVSYTAVGTDLYTYNKACSFCGYSENISNINQEGKIVVNADYLAIYADLWKDANLTCKASEYVAGGSQRYTYESGVDASNNNLPYLHLVSKSTAENYFYITNGVRCDTAGQYMSILFRSDAARNASQVFGTTGNSDGNSNEWFTQSSTAGWNLFVVDLSKLSGMTDLNVVNWLRWDFLESHKVGNYMDIAYVTFSSTEAKAYEYYERWVDAYVGADECDHFGAADIEGKPLSQLCPICDSVMSKANTTNSDGLLTFTPADILAGLGTPERVDSMNPQFGLDDKANNMPYVTLSAPGGENGKPNGLWSSEPKTNVGKIMGVLYRTTTATSVGSFVNTELNFIGNCNSSVNLNKNGNWNLAIIDFTNMPATAAAAGKDKSGNQLGYFDANTGLRWIRLDFFYNSSADPNVKLDIAYWSLFETKQDAYDYYKEFLDAYIGVANCDHKSDGNTIAHTEAGKICETCLVCGEYINVRACNHPDSTKYSDIKATSDPLVCTVDCAFCKANDASVKGITPDGLKIFTPEEIYNAIKDDDRFTSSVVTPDAAATTNKFPYLSIVTAEGRPSETNISLPCGNGIKNVGSYIAIYYRRNAKVTGYLQMYLNSGTGVAEPNTNTPNPTVEEWGLYVMKAENQNFVPADGLGSFRFDIFDGTAGHAAGAEVDIAYIAFFETSDAAYSYFRNNFAPNSGVVKFTPKFDNVKVDGVNQTMNQNGSENRPMYTNVNSAVLSTPKSITVAGWCVTPGGVSKYQYRVTVQGETTSVVHDLVTDPGSGGALTGATIGAEGYNRGYGEASTNGASFQGNRTVDLSAYQNKTVDIEIHAQTVNGDTLVIGLIRNVHVPCMHEDAVVTFDTENYKKTVDCNDCDLVETVDCPHTNSNVTYDTTNYTKSVVCDDCTYAAEAVACDHGNGKDVTGVYTATADLYTVTSPCKNCTYPVEFKNTNTDGMPVYAGQGLYDHVEAKSSNTIDLGVKPGEEGGRYTYELMAATDADPAYVRLVSKSTSENFLMINRGAYVTGAKVVTIVYRLNAPSIAAVNNNSEMFASSTAVDFENGKFSNKYVTIKSNESWQVWVYDLSAHEATGKYEDAHNKLGWLRWDFFNGGHKVGQYVDIAYIGLFNSVESANAFYEKWDLLHCPHTNITASWVTGEAKETLTCADCGKTIGTRNASVVVSHDNIYIGSTTTLGAGGTFGSNGGFTGTVNTAVTTGKTASETLSVAFGGWVAVNGGAKQIKWSADGGQTWYDCSNTALTAGTPLANSEAHTKVVHDRFKAIDTYKSVGIADTTCTGLLTHYAGQTVDITYGVVPTDNPTVVVPFSVLTGIVVPQATTAAE